MALVIAASVVAGKLIGNPFKTETVDRTPPPVLNEIHNLAEYHAAQGSFEVLVDIEEDVNNIPAVLKGERVLFVGVGTVDAVVDFTNLADEALTVSEDGTSIVVTLPRARLESAVIDYELSHVVDRDRGVLDRIEGVFSDNPTSEQELYVVAGERITAAAASTDMLQRAEDNTKLMLYSMLKLGGFTSVDVQFVGDAPVGTALATG